MDTSPRRSARPLLTLVVCLNLAVAGAALFSIVVEPAALARPADQPLSPADQAILDQVAELTGADDLAARPGPAGTSFVDLSGRAQGVLLVREAADGSAVVRCVYTIEEARAFLEGSDPVTAAQLAGLEAETDQIRAALVSQPRSLDQLLASTDTVINVTFTDGAGVGFNDPTPAAPVGGNPGTTVGEQRRLAFQYAAAIWANALQSTVPIEIEASFAPLRCTATSGTLGSAGPQQVFSFDPAELPAGALADVWYPVALANKLAGEDLAPAPGSAESPASDISARFNGNLGTPGCLENSRWYYGFDGNEGPGGTDLVTVLLHEFAHGLGFISIVDVGSGQNLQGRDDIWNAFLFDNTIGRLWKDMSDAERQASTISVDQLVWAGAATRAEAPYGLRASALLSVTAPLALAGSYDLSTAGFGARPPAAPLSGDVTAALDAGPATADACSPLTNAAAVAGTIALAEQGGCDDSVKARNAQAAGALALLVYDDADDTAPPALSGEADDLLIPALGLTRADGLSLRPAAEAGELVAQIGLELGTIAVLDPAGRPRMHAPNPVRQGSSVSHFSTSALPNLLMEPSINPDIGQSLDLTDELMRDIGWYPDRNYNLVDDRSEIDLVVTQTITPAGLLSAGDALTLTVTVRNPGSIAATARLLDDLPARLSEVSWSAAYSGGASGPASGAGDIDASLSLPAGSSAVFTIGARLTAGPPEQISNVASLSLSAGSDVNPSDNSAAVILLTANERLLLPLILLELEE